jgi:predicted methyltransferase
MKFFTLVAIFTIAFTSSVFANVDATLTEAEKATLQKLIDSDTRSEGIRDRNKYRNPLETLTFFGVKETQTVVEIWPGGQGGWYRSILAPYLAENGTYIPVRSNSDFPKAIDIVKDNSADRVLVFRAHGFMIYNNPAQEYFDAIFKMLKPGGVLGIVDHRGDESIPQDPNGENGYVNQSHVLMLAKNAGLELVASAEVNANPKDTKNYPNGLYSLPPSLKGSIFNRQLREKVLAIGESDRMTLKFVKPL